MRELLPQAEAKDTKQAKPTAGPVIVFGTLASAVYGVILMLIRLLR